MTSPLQYRPPIGSGSPIGGGKPLPSPGQDGSVVVRVGSEPIATGVGVKLNSGTTTARRARINLIEGGGCTITVSDNTTTGDIDITISVP